MEQQSVFNYSEPPAAEAVPQPEPLPPLPEFRQLDRRVIKLWRAGDAIGYGILLLGSLIGLVVWAFVKGTFVFPLTALWLALFGLCVWILTAYPPRAWQAWAYRLDDRVLETRQGVWWQKTQLLPLNRLQHVDLQRGPFERMFGLASLVLYTAGTHNASLTIPGLAAEEATRLRDHLIRLGLDDGVEDAA